MPREGIPRMFRRFIPALVIAMTASCSPATRATGPAVRIAHLGRPGAAADLARIRAAFAHGNPGYELDYAPELDGLAADGRPRIAFVQSGAGAATVAGESTELAMGDIVLLRPGESLADDGRHSAVVFTVTDPLPPSLPTFIRPDWDPAITDTPGGCAEETGAYRRILLTWLDTVGPYVYHGLNAHRVRIVDSFSHYHPVEGGFDELYLVQMALPGAKLYTSERTESIENPDSVTRAEAATLLDEHPLAVGDLVYLPRGTVHRGFGGALVQVITVPGFRPGAEIGVDHLLREINERLGLTGDAALPFHAAAAGERVVK